MDALLNWRVNDHRVDNDEDVKSNSLKRPSHERMNAVDVSNHSIYLRPRTEHVLNYDIEFLGRVGNEFRSELGIARLGKDSAQSVDIDILKRLESCYF